MNITTSTCVQILSCFRDTFPNDIIKIIIMMVLETLKVKMYMNGYNIVIVKDGYLYTNKLTRSNIINLNKTKHKHVKLIHFADTFGNYEVLHNVDISSDVVKIKSGTGYVISLSKEGFLFSKGANGFGQLGLDDYVDRTTFERIKLSNVAKFWCGTNNNCVSLKTCDFYVFGSLGTDLSQINYCSPQLCQITDIIKASCSHNYGVALCKNSIFGWGGSINITLVNKCQTISPVCLDFNNIQNIVNISAGLFNIFILTNDGEICSLDITHVEHNCGYFEPYARPRFRKVCVKMTHIIKIKCASSAIFMINNEMEIQLLDLLESRQHKIVLRDAEPQQNVIRNNETTDIPLFIIFVSLMMIPMIIYVCNK